MSKFGDDIRRISRYQELLDLINQKVSENQKQKDPIDGNKGIAYNNGDGSVSSSSTGKPGVTKPDNNNVTTPVDKPRVDKDPGESKNDSDTVGDDDLSDPDNSDRDGWYDIDSLMNGEADDFGKYPPNENDGKLINSLTGLSSGGRGIVTHFKDADHAFVAPGDRADQNEKLDDPDYTAGFFYRVNNGGPDTQEDVPTVSEAITSGQNYLDSVLPPPRPPVTFDGWYTTGGSPSTPPDTVGVPKFARYLDTLSNISNITVNFVACTITSSIYACPISIPFLPWEDLSATQLAWVTQNSASVSPFNFSMIGKFVPHPYDDNVPANYLLGASVLKLDTAKGNTVQIGPLATGGWYAAYTDSLGGAISGGADSATVLKINADRSHGGFITPNALTKMISPSP